MLEVIIGEMPSSMNNRVPLEEFIETSAKELDNLLRRYQHMHVSDHDLLPGRGQFFLTDRELSDLQCDLAMERKVFYTNAGGFI